MTQLSSNRQVPEVAPRSRTQFAQDINAAFADLESNSLGATFPENPRDGMIAVITGTTDLWLEYRYHAATTTWILRGKYYLPDEKFYPVGYPIRTSPIIATGTYNFHPAAARFDCDMIAATGAGGGANSTTSDRASGGTGGNTGRRIRWISELDDLIRTASAVIGSGGVGVGGANGGNGGTSSLTYDGRTVTLLGGLGGILGVDATGNPTGLPQALPDYTPTDTEELLSLGEQGGHSYVEGTTRTGTGFCNALSGRGPGPFGGAARYISQNTSGNQLGQDARGPDSAGSGAICIKAAAAVRGGHGFRGHFLMTEIA